MKNFVFIFYTILFLCFSCKSKPTNFIAYYNETLVADSILRIAKDTVKAQKIFQHNFRKYGIHNQESIKEYETYILISYKLEKNFGGKKNLYKLIDLITPYKKIYDDYSFFKLYGIDSVEIENRYKIVEKKYNQIVIDSFKVARFRDQFYRKDGFNEQTRIADLKNIKLFKWCFENYGFPSVKKVGSLDSLPNNSFYGVMFIHFISYPEEYKYLEKELPKYIKSGECNPYSYAAMVDRQNIAIKKTKSFYNIRTDFRDLTKLDSLEINRNRKLIGLPSMNHANAIQYNYKQKLKL
jgi:hypothetical protein